MLAVEFIQDKETRTFLDPSQLTGAKVAAALLKRGVIARAMPQGDILGFAPPLCLTKTEADTIVGAMSEGVGEVFDNA